MNKYKVYVYAICKDEEPFAARFMQSAREADGVYVLDTGSRDGTVAALRALGAHVERRDITPWRFDRARNASLEHVPQDADICVCIDLDEAFLPGWRAAVEEAWARGAQQVRYRYVWNFTPDGREDTVFYADKIHARHGFVWKHPVHEALYWTGEGEPRREVAQGAQLEHRADESKPRAQYLPLLELAVAEDPQNDRNRHYLGREYLFHGRWEDCIRTLREHLALPSATWRDERSASMRYIADACAHMGNAYDRESWLLRAAGEAPHLREPWLDLARMADEMADWPGVLFYAERALRIHDRPRTYITRGASYGALPYDLLSVACYHMGLKARAQEAVARALELSPEDERIIQNKRWIDNMP